MISTSSTSTRSTMTTVFCSAIALLAAFPLQAAEVTPDRISVVLTTPTQEHFTIGAVPGALVQVTNTPSGERYAFTVAHSEVRAAAAPASPRTDRKNPELVSLRIFRIAESEQGNLLNPVGAIDGLRAGEEFVEPKTGFVFRPIPAAEGKDYWAKSGGTSGLTMCCVDCGAYMVCGARVSACGRVCNNDVPPPPLGDVQCRQPAIDADAGENPPN